MPNKTDTQTTIKSNETHACSSALCCFLYIFYTETIITTAKVRKMRHHNVHKFQQQKNWVGVLVLLLLFKQFRFELAVTELSRKRRRNAARKRKTDNDCTAFQRISRKYMITIITTNNSNTVSHKRYVHNARVNFLRWTYYYYYYNFFLQVYCVYG